MVPDVCDVPCNLHHGFVLLWRESASVLVVVDEALVELMEVASGHLHLIDTSVEDTVRSHLF